MMDENIRSHLPGKSAHVVSLGCSKNLVDTENMCDILKNAGMILVPKPDNANVIIINTCGFIESAKSEAIDKILEMVDYKENGNCNFLVVTGCLGQRYHEEIERDLPEVDAILGVASYDKITDTLEKLYSENKQRTDKLKGNHTVVKEVSLTDRCGHLSARRTPSTKYFAYLKISEGCSNKCSYCAIPLIRGEYISRPREDILSEAQSLAEKGISEIVLVAQDTTRYGIDIYGKRTLHEILQKISKIDKVERIRLMYCYCNGITDDLIKEIKTNPKVAKYLDIPIQHADDDILKRMNRKDTTKSIRSTIEKLRKEIPGISLRTTVLVGFPGETEQEFQNLHEFIKEIKFNFLGCFVFSAEEGTEAFDMEPKIDKSIAQKRQNDIMTSQREISYDINRKMIGTRVDVIIEGIDDEGIFYFGRDEKRAPETDPCIYVLAGSKELELGKTYNIKIVDADEYDLTGVAT